jgi:hypothetical protein
MMMAASVLPIPSQQQQQQQSELQPNIGHLSTSS